MLLDRYNEVKALLPQLWNDNAGTYLNKNTADGSWVMWEHPPHIYPLLAAETPDDQAAYPSSLDLKTYGHAQIAHLFLPPLFTTVV